MIGNFLTALRFLTVFPAGKNPASPDLAKSMLFFPVIGFLIGLASLFLFSLAQKFLPFRAAVLVLMISPVLLNGGLHLDGFTDFCDGFFGGRDREGILRIMKDSRVGTWGVFGLFILLMAKFELLQDLPFRAKTFLLALTASRWAQVMASYFLPYARPEGGLGEGVAGKIKRTQIFGASLFFLPVLIWNGGSGLAIFCGLLVFLFLTGIFYKKKIGGVTGDLLGAVSEMSELVVYVLAFLFIGAGT